MGEIAHCDTGETFYGNYLSLHPDYQAIEEKNYTSLVTYDISCGIPAPGYSLSGNVPPNLVCETPGSTATRLIAKPIGSMFPNNTELIEVINQYQVEPMIFPIAGSDQGTMVIQPSQTCNDVTMTYDFVLEYDGLDSKNAPCKTALGLTLIVMVNWENQSYAVCPAILQKVQDVKNA